jgi:hypothetical protein
MKAPTQSNTLNATAAASHQAEWSTGMAGSTAISTPA